MSDKKLWDQYVAMEKERDALLAENEALAANLRGKHSTTGATYAHLIEDRDELRAKVEEMERQEPVAWMQSTHLSSFKNRLCGSQSSYVHCSDHQLHPDFKPLYALPGAKEQEPTRDWWDCLIADISAIDCMYRGSPTYAHDAYWMRDHVVWMLKKRRDALPGAKPAPSVPEGWQLVPTAESRHPGIYKMLGALHAADNTPGMSEWESYRAMLSEAPEATP